VSLGTRLMGWWGRVLWGGCKTLGRRALRWDGLGWDGMALGIPVCPNRVRFGVFCGWLWGFCSDIANDMICLASHCYSLTAV
jgi:hypothetical protein